MNRRNLLWIAASLAAVAVLLAVSGGVRATVGGFRISARSPVPAAVMAVLVAGAWWMLAQRARAVASDLLSAWSTIARRHLPIIAGIAILGGAVAACFATNSASGADASGYLSQARMWESGTLFGRDELALAIGATDPWLTSALGWRPAPIAALQAPTYPPGLPWLMAVVPGTTYSGLIIVASSAIATIATGVVAARLAGGIAGVMAAMFLAVSPVFLFQSVQPMSDVPVTAAWMTCWALLAKPGSGVRDPGSALSFLAGAACAVAVLIRPNLAPLAAVPLFAIGARVRRLVTFSIPVALAAAVLMWLQWTWYGSPFRSGYGTAEELFALANIGANSSRYLSWLVATSPLMLAAPLGVFLVWRQNQAKALAGFAALVVGAYLVYAVFDVWSYLRFLLPAMAVAAVFTGVAFAAGLNRLTPALRLLVLLVVSLGAISHGVSEARSRDTFRLAGQQRRVAQVGEYLASTLPGHAVIVAGEQSGAFRYYTGRSILRWDAATPESLAWSLVALGATGRPVVVALDAWERELFRARFASLSSVSLEWPPALEAGTSHRTLVWRLADRDIFLRGERVDTIRQP